ncbi:hypothetical protein B0H17DRAFT_1213396 [Mycena rosella]|uniref:Uncharacterized protein n=1 Tax=Mycena rosella TaxID=1033263 RepID=A0AAD7G437_MYCRO|nr:hypothetical protein B0H17DRAFT_1213396 [Mycena rosella]
MAYPYLWAPLAPTLTNTGPVFAYAHCAHHPSRPNPDTPPLVINNTDRAPPSKLKDPFHGHIRILAPTSLPRNLCASRPRRRDIGAIHIHTTAASASHTTAAPPQALDLRAPAYAAAVILHEHPWYLRGAPPMTLDVPISILHPASDILHNTPASRMHPSGFAVFSHPHLNPRALHPRRAAAFLPLDFRCRMGAG